MRSEGKGNRGERGMTEAPGDSPVLVALDGGVLRITLNRPERLNAFNTAMHDTLRAALHRAETEAEVRAVLLTGAGRGFCAGQDLSERDPRKLIAEGRWPPNLSETLSHNYNPLIRRLRDLPKPVICAVNGVAAGAGANLALACDIVLAARSARFIQAFAKLGLVPDAGGTWFLPRLIGEARAKALAFTAEPLDAQTAADWGLIWRAVEDEHLMQEAEALAHRLASGPTYGLGLAKAAIQEAATNDLSAQLDLEAESQFRAGASPDYAEGVAAFLEKRAPKFTGRPE